MLWALFSPILSSFSTIFIKKSLLTTQVSTYFFALLEYIGYILPILYLLVLGFSDITVNYAIYVFTFSVCAAWVVIAVLSQQVYTQEKISVLAPYENISKVIVIICSYFLFGDVSGITVLIALSIVCLITFTALDLKNLSFPKFFKKFLVYQLLLAYTTLMIGYILKQVSSEFYFVIESIFLIILYILILYLRNEIGDYKRGTKLFYINRLTASFLSAFAYFISLFIISDSGVVVSIIIGFLYLGCVLLLSKVFFNDIPEKKSIILALCVSVLVGLALYFNT